MLRKRISFLIILVLLQLRTINSQLDYSRSENRHWIRDSLNQPGGLLKYDPDDSASDIDQLIELCTAYPQNVDQYKLLADLVDGLKPYNVNFKYFMEILKGDLTGIHNHEGIGQQSGMLEREPNGSFLKYTELYMFILCHCLQENMLHDNSGVVKANWRTSHQLDEDPEKEDGRYKEIADYFDSPRRRDVLKAFTDKSKRNEKYLSKLNVRVPTGMLFELCPPDVEQVDCYTEILSMFVALKSASSMAGRSKKSDKPHCESPHRLGCLFKNLNIGMTSSLQNKQYPSNSDNLSSTKRNAGLCLSADNKPDCFDHYMRAMVMHKVSNSRNLNSFIGRKARR